MNKQRVEHISQLFLNAGVILHRALGRAGGQYHFDERPGGPVHLVKHTPLYNWAKGDRYTYRDRGKTVRDITIDTLKDALLTQLPEQWAHVSIAVVEEPSVVHTANIPEGATHYRGTTRRLYYKKAADGGWLFYNHVVGNWQTSILFAVERDTSPFNSSRLHGM